MDNNILFRIAIVRKDAHPKTDILIEVDQLFEIQSNNNYLKYFIKKSKYYNYLVIVVNDFNQQVYSRSIFDI